MKKILNFSIVSLLTMSMLCVPLSALANTAQTNAAYVTEYHRDLRVTIPANMTYNWLEGRWATLEIYMDPQSSSGFLNIAARQMHTQDPPISTDEQGLPVLNTDSVRELLSGTENISASVLNSGKTQLAGVPATYIEVLFHDDTEGENPDWKAKVIRAIYEGFAYDIMYAAPAEEYEQYLSVADSITALVQFDTRGSETESVALGDITLAHPIRNMNAGSTDTSFQISVSVTGIESLFRAEYDNSKIYEEGFLDNIHWLNLHLKDMTEKIIPININQDAVKNDWESTELFREETLINGKRALRVAYHIYDKQFYTNNYAEVIVFTFNGGLYSLFIKDREGEEARLHEFANPIIDSIRFNEGAPSPTAAPSTDTVRWINYANAVLTLANHGDVERFGGMEPTFDTQRAVRNALEKSWGITSRDSLDAALTRLRETGHRAVFASIVADFPQLFGLDEEDFSAAVQNETEVLREIKRVLEVKISFLKELLGEGSALNVIGQEIASVLIEKEMAELAKLESTLDMMDSAAVRRYLEQINRTYLDSGENALLAWDYVRAMNLISEGYLVGFYSYEEALELSLEFAKELQDAFSSWDALYGDYLAGYAFWNQGDENDPTTENYRRAELIRGLMLLSKGPSSFPYDTPLTAEWPEPPESKTVESEYMELMEDVIAPIDTHGQPDHASFGAGETVEFLLTADMFKWTNMDALALNSATIYGWDAITNFEKSPVTPDILINSGVSAAFESETPQIIRTVDITETAYPQPGFSNLRTACVKVVFANEFAELHGKEFEATLYLTLEGKRVPMSEITLAGTLFDDNAEQSLIRQKLVRTRMIVSIILLIAVISLVAFLVHRQKKQRAYQGAMWENSPVPEEKSCNSDDIEKHVDN